MIGRVLGGRRILSGPLGVTPASAAAVSRWLTGGIPAANCMAAYEPKGAASLAASYTNLNNPGANDAYLGVAPGWSAALGWIATGTQYLRTGLYPTQTWSVIVQYSASTWDALFGAVDGTGKTIEIFLAGAVVSFIDFGNTASTAPVLLSGNLAVTPTGTYRNGVFDASLTVNVFGTCARDIWILASNRSAAPPYYPMVGNMQAIYIYNINISAYVAGLAAAMAF